MSYRALSAPTQNKVKNIFKIIWWFKKNAILLSFGEVAEWSIAAVLKTVELRGSGGSNPSLSADHEAKRCREIDTFCFYTFGASLLADRGVKNKRWAACCFLRSWACKGPCGEQRGWTLSGAGFKTAP